MEFTGKAGERLDLFLKAELPEVSRSKIQAWIKGGDVLVNREVILKAKFVLGDGDNVFVKDAAMNVNGELESEDLDLEVLYEDESCLVIDKPEGVVVHPGNDGKHRSGTVVNKVLSRLDINGGDRPGIVHRLDKDTSGALIIAKTEDAYENLVGQFKKREVFKSYIALVDGKLNYESGVVDSPIGRSMKDRKQMAIMRTSDGGKEAKTRFRLLEEFVLPDSRIVSLVQVQILTGRTHQIRVHMEAIGHPVVGDMTYGARGINAYFKEEFDLDRQFLHAAVLGFKSPGTGKEVKIKAPLPEALNSILERLRD